MAKLLLLIVIGAIVYFIVKSYARNIAAGARKEAQAKPQEDMVQCVRCGVHLPKSESVAAEGRYFCSEEHRRLHS